MLHPQAETWAREPIIVEALPVEAYPLYASWYAEIADTAEQIGNTGEAEYARSMVAKFTGGQP